MLLGHEYVSEFLLRAIRLAARHGFEAEAYYYGEVLRGMRSARQGIHQTPTAREGELVLRLRKTTRGKTRAVEVVVSSPADIGTAVRQGKELIASARPNPLLYQLEPQPADLPEERLRLQVVPKQFWDDLPTKSAAFRTIRKDAVETPGWYGAGYFLTAAHEIGAANSSGLLRYAAGCYSGFTVVATGGKRQRQLTTYAEDFAKLPQEIDYRRVVAEAFVRARLTDGLPFLEPLNGRSRIQMDAVLSPNCVNDWIKDLTPTFCGYAVHNGESYVSDRVRGKSRIASSCVTLRDDWQDPRGLAVPFDLEGRTRQQVILIDHGVYAGHCHDGMSAIVAGEAPTGHSGFELGTGTPDLLVLGGEDHSMEDLVVSCDRPALILTWPHYSSDMYEKEGMWTVTGHHGVFLAKGGRIVAVCPPTRIRLRTFDALRRVEMLSASQPVFDVERYPLTLPSSAVVPGIKLRNVEFLNF
ncbi:MAG: hypothetical protein HY978_02055 [Candidatus Liptonbacteria bacterium]|nr:hypothetical protein [Candidatus Liptonbacteria bacterium]